MTDGIKAGTFSVCRKLENINLENVTNIGNSAFSNCEKLSYANLENVTNIGNSAFNNCSSLNNISIPNITSIGKSVFKSCSSLTNIDAPNITSIGKNAFNSSGITSINSSKITNIDNNAFQRCKNLETINLSNVETVNIRVFYNCTNLKSANLPNVTNIGLEAFSNCNQLSNVYVPNIKTINGYAFSKCTSLENIDISNATSISGYAFSESGITSINLPNITNISSNMFSGCTRLKNVSMPKATIIGENAFKGCTSLTEINIPEVTRLVSTNAFNNTNNLKCIYVYQPRQGGVLIEGVDLDITKIYYLGEFIDIKTDISRESSNVFKFTQTYSTGGAVIQSLYLYKNGNKEEEIIQGNKIQVDKQYLYTTNNLINLEDDIYRFGATANFVGTDNQPELRSRDIEINITGFVNYLDSSGNHIEGILDKNHYEVGEKIDLTKTIPQGNGVFLGWSLTPDGTDIVREVYMNSTNVNLYPVFDLNAEKSILMLDYGYLKDGSTQKIIETYVSSNITLPKVDEDDRLTRDGYEFLGWSMLKGDTNYISELLITEESVTVYANWKKVNESENTTDRNNETTTKDSVESTTDGNNETTTKDSIESTTDENAETTTKDNVESTTDGNTEITTKDSVESTTDGNTENTTRDGVESTTDGNTENTTRDNVESTTDGNTENTTNNQVTPPVIDGGNNDNSLNGDVNNSNQNENTSQPTYVFGNLQVITPEDEQVAKELIATLVPEQKEVVNSIDKLIESATSNGSKINEKRQTEKPAFGFGAEGNISLLIILLLLLIILIIAYVIKKQLINKENLYDEEEGDTNDSTLKL